jgi:hypothetical protein
MRYRYESDWETRRAMTAEAREQIDPAVAAIVKARAEGRLEPPPINRDRMRAAHNEAAHAVMALYLSRPVFSVECDDLGGGACRHAPPSLNAELAPRTAADDSKSWDYLVKNVEFNADFVRQQGLTLLAAPCAVQILTGGHVGCADDLARVESLIANLSLSRQERAQLYDDLLAESCGFINTFWSEVEAVAKCLYDRGLLFENDIKQVLRRSFAGRVVILRELDELRERKAPAATEVTRVLDDVGVTIGAITRSTNGRFVAQGLGGHPLGTLDTFAAAERTIREAVPLGLRFRVDGYMPA